jgi:hypothetical protein
MSFLIFIATLILIGVFWRAVLAGALFIIAVCATVIGVVWGVELIHSTLEPKPHQATAQGEVQQTPPSWGLEDIVQQPEAVPTAPQAAPTPQPTAPKQVQPGHYFRT